MSVLKLNVHTYLRHNEKESKAEYISTLLNFCAWISNFVMKESVCESPEYMVCVKILGTLFLRHNEREECPNILLLLRLCTLILYVVTRERDRERRDRKYFLC